VSLIADILYPQLTYDLTNLQVKTIYQLDGFDGALSLFPYHPPIKDIITDIKYNFITDIIPNLVNLATTSLINHFPNLLNYWQDKNFVLIPVPLHEFRQNWRGFNQSELIGSHLASTLHLQYNNLLVTRTHISVSQVSLPDKQLRLHNENTSFTLNASPPQNIILFDDVITTGSTIKSLASIFPKNSCLWALSIAG
jgi:ComF family protein